MIRNLVAVAAVSGLMMSTALAQSPAPNATPGSTGSSTGSSMGSSSGSGAMGSNTSAGAGAVITQQSPNQWLASKFMGTDVIGTDDAKIGDVSDVLFDKSGKVDALIVGVGGFLGIGQKDIALPVSSFQVIAANSGRNNTSSDQLRLSMTKDQLQQQAEFKTSDDTNRTTTGAGSGAAGTGGGAATTPRTNMGTGSGAATGTPNR
ncbi:PRC-barrel domain-containing protein [Rhodoplanes sp. TEM]|uniref:PRC-barrel domain-containing protein n=1 Tax=Rhodoplanes tepidamans TaxID=200616 RepID=A0ABT5J6T6_RHOTP|nr:MULTISPECIES: PRC-barrel domain-containing protein [Rhodoplanes]MDC7785367.1 PRC-barrel domain-containing protein [Rhodoplanes tepidamans]MDC7984325.1 PRC-barrel domain-containing protein [Rhodoplanes sp. TEM]MDQ0353181.1 sporulation protein YlmC with PRC-barrel domain [Rhodoplanes tepidamans]